MVRSSIIASVTFLVVFWFCPSFMNEAINLWYFSAVTYPYLFWRITRSYRYVPFYYKKVMSSIKQRVAKNPGKKDLHANHYISVNNLEKLLMKTVMTEKKKVYL
ncbi:hypothetical protein QT15_03420 [Pseudoalteromonas flavipulchra NCIMB 2033 = ATCC BAA-314]|nr:hypothetical protein QT15_03420 [Pseudoalteromonas flavipulchra NCIMB 2033 = ATCC BAA-314]